MRYRFTIEYFGAPFAGWQLQDDVPTVQGELEKALGVILRKTNAPVRVHGAGRTDAGVHATGQVAHVDLDAGAPEPRRLQHALNALTGPHVRVRGMERCGDSFHARFDALARAYLYRIALRPVAQLAPLSWHPAGPFDGEILAAELATALGKHDFLNFSIPRNDGKSTMCEVVRADAAREGAFLHLRIEADRFLHKMVRSLVGAAFDVSRGAHPPGLIRAILEDRFAGQRFWAPPHGLSLERVTYPDGYDAGP